MELTDRLKNFPLLKLIIICFSPFIMCIVLAIVGTIYGTIVTEIPFVDYVKGSTSGLTALIVIGFVSSLIFLVPVLIIRSRN